jgi:hypothetical protein
MMFDPLLTSPRRLLQPPTACASFLSCSRRLRRHPKRLNTHIRDEMVPHTARSSYGVVTAPSQAIGVASPIRPVAVSGPCRTRGDPIRSRTIMWASTLDSV